jgi:hypothetical protein
MLFVVRHCFAGTLPKKFQQLARQKAGYALLQLGVPVACRGVLGVK